MKTEEPGGAGHLRQDKLAGNGIDGNCGSPKGEEPTPKKMTGAGRGPTAAAVMDEVRTKRYLLVW